MSALIHITPKNDINDIRASVTSVHFSAAEKVACDKAIQLAYENPGQTFIGIDGHTGKKAFEAYISRQGRERFVFPY